MFVVMAAYRRKGRGIETPWYQARACRDGLSEECRLRLDDCEGDGDWFRVGERPYPKCNIREQFVSFCQFERRELR